MTAGAMSLNGCGTQQTILLTWVPIMAFWGYYWLPPDTDQQFIPADTAQVQILAGIRSAVNVSDAPFTLDLSKITPIDGGTQQTYSATVLAARIEKDYPGYLGLNGPATRMLDVPAHVKEAVYNDGAPKAIHLLFSVPYDWTEVNDTQTLPELVYGKTMPQLTYAGNSSTLQVGLIRFAPSKLPLRLLVNGDRLKQSGKYYATS